MKQTCLVFDNHYNRVLHVGTLLYHPNGGMVKSAHVYSGNYWLQIDTDGNARATDAGGVVHHSWTFKTVSIIVIESDHEFYEMSGAQIVSLIKTTPPRNVWDAVTESSKSVTNHLLGIDSKTIQLNFLRNIERELLSRGGKSVARNRWLKSPNWKKVKDYLMNGTSTGGKTSATEQCLFLGIEPDDYRIDPL